MTAARADWSHTVPSKGKGEPASAAIPELGESFGGRYRVERVLGCGGMGVVVAARHVMLDQLVAVKILRPEAVKSSEAVARFLREARAVAKLQSEHVARVVDIGELDNGLPFMVMECLEGADLEKLLQLRGEFPTNEAVDLVLAALEAIAEAHAFGVVHRDLKPSNLFLADRRDGTTTLKVLDFGVSKLVATSGDEVAGELTATQSLLGSPAYMSPEQMRSSRTVDARTDIWSMGVILFQLLTGDLPFSGSTFGEILTAVLMQPVPLIRSMRVGVPAELDAIVAKCLERNRDARFANVAELARALAPFGSARARPSVLSISRLLSYGESSGPETQRYEDPAEGRAATGDAGADVTAPRVRHRARIVGIVGIAAAVVLGSSALAAAAWHAGRSSATTAPAAPR